MELVSQKIYLLALKKSKKREGIIYCIGVHQLGTSNMEFILGEIDADREYNIGDEVSYIYHADYTRNLQNALDWLLQVK